MESKAVRIDELLAHAGWVRRLAAGLVRDAATADDVVQDVWTSVLRSPPKARANLRAWLGAAVRNRVRSMQRGEVRRADHESRSPARSEEPSAAELVERAHLHRELVDHVLALDDPHRSIVLAHWFEGRSIAAIARQHGTTPRVAKARLEEAHARLRRRMDGTPGGRQGWILAFAQWTAAPTLTPPAVAGAWNTGGILMAIKYAAAGAAMLLVAALGWHYWPRQEIRGPSSSEVARVEPATLPEAPSKAAATEAGTRREVTAAESAPPDPPPLPAPNGPEWPENFVPNLLAQIEGTLVSKLDPNAFLDAALLLTQLELDPRAIPEPWPSGAIRYRMLGAPEGMKVELWLNPAPNSEFDKKNLSLRIEMQVPDSAAYVQHGVPRKNPETHIYVLRAPDGAVTGFSLLTNFYENGRQARRSGVDLTVGRYPQGLLYHHDVADPARPIASACWIENGQTKEGIDPAAHILGTPDAAKLDQLSKNFLGLYDELVK